MVHLLACSGTRRLSDRFTHGVRGFSAANLAGVRLTEGDYADMMAGGILYLSEPGPRGIHGRSFWTAIVDPGGMCASEAV